MNTNKYTNIDEYIESAPKEVRPKLKELRKFIHDTAPNLTEKISYGMAAFNLNDKYLVYFAYNKKHIGFYPFPSGISEFKSDAEKLGFKTSKGTIQFPYDRDIPFDLVKKIVKFRVKE